MRRGFTGLRILRSEKDHVALVGTAYGFRDAPASAYAGRATCAIPLPAAEVVPAVEALKGRFELVRCAGCQRGTYPATAAVGFVGSRLRTPRGKPLHTASDLHGREIQPA